MWDGGGPHEIPSRAACGPRAVGWTALIYIIYSYVLHIAHFQFGTVSNHLNLALCRI